MVNTNNVIQSSGVQWVQRLASSVGMTLSDKDAHWWAVYLRQFFRYARQHGVQSEVLPLVQAYLSDLGQRLPPDRGWQVAKIRRVLEVFVGAIENWRWVQEEGEWKPKFRLKKQQAIGETHGG